MDAKEQEVLDLLGQAWNAFIKLELLHPDDVPEFRHAIHAAQNIVLARPAFRAQHQLEPEITINFCQGGDIKQIEQTVYKTRSDVMKGT